MTNSSAADASKNLAKLLRQITLEPEVLRIIGEESERNGADRLSSRRIEQVIRQTRSQKAKLS
jgi:hypothetical protein